MTPTTKPEVWPTDKPMIVFMVPEERCFEYAMVMRRLAQMALQDLNWEPDSIEAIGLISHTPEHTAEGVIFLEETGIDTRRLTLLMLWGDTAEGINFDQVASEECGVGTVILPTTGVILPTVRMPSLDSGWWDDSLHQEYALTVFTGLIKDVRAERDTSSPPVFVSLPYVWN